MTINILAILCSVILFFGLLIFAARSYINNIYKFNKFFLNLRSDLHPKKLQKHFYLYEKYKERIAVYGTKYLYFNKFLFEIKKNKHKFKIKKDIIKIIIVYFNKQSKFFNYVLNKKNNFNRLVSNVSINYFKIDAKNQKSFDIEPEDSGHVLKTFFISKKEKKKLVLLLFFDGLSLGLTKYCNNTKKFFSKDNSFNHAYTNSSWTLPTFSNLITGQYTSRHLNFYPKTYYGSHASKKNKATFVNPYMNLFEFFKSKNFITGSYSPYDRINPSYEFNKGVDLFKYCKEQNTNEIVDDVIAQLEMFNESSNFIFAHLFDVHSKARHFNEISDYSNFSYENFDYEKKINETVGKVKRQSKYQQFIKIKNFQEKEQTISDTKYSDFRLNILYRYLESKKFDDYTIILMGDHGTRLDKSQSMDNLNRDYQNIGLFVKDKKYKFKNKKNNIIETIDIFPSLVSRYSQNSSPEKLIGQFDGKNTLFSNYRKNYSISESIYNQNYDFILQTKKISFNSAYKINNNLQLENYYKKYTNEKGKELNLDNKKKETQKINFIEKQHVKKIDLT